MHYDYIVVGAGSMGMAAGYFLAKESKSVLLLDAFEPPHSRGSHHGETRLIRLAYGEGERYVPFVLRAYELWQELADLSNQVIFQSTGILNFTPKNDPFINNVKSSAERYGLPLEHLTANDVNRRWDGIRLGAHMEACYEPTSGVLMSENVIEAYYQLAIKEGATFIGNSRVVHIEPNNEIVHVTTEHGEVYTANSIIVSVGAWAKKLVEQMNITLPVTPIRKVFAWYEADEELYGDHVFPGFIYTNKDLTYYGFPSIDGAGLKVGRHDAGEPINPDDPLASFGAQQGDREDLDEFLTTFMPGVGSLTYGKTCMYTMTPDSDFIIDTLPGYPNMVIAAGFSGHGFKFASAVGEALKDLALQKGTKVDLDSFSLDRFK